MNKFFGFVLLALAVVSLLPLCGCPSGGSLSEGGKAPDFSVEDVSGKEVRLSDFAGKKVVLNVWASWCGPCRGELPLFNDAYEKYDKDKVVFMMVNIDSDGPKGALDLVEKEGYKFPVYFDSKNECAPLYAPNFIPVTVIVDEKGRVEKTFAGAIKEDVLDKHL